MNNWLSYNTIYCPLQKEGEAEIERRASVVSPGPIKSTLRTTTVNNSSARPNSSNSNTNPRVGRRVPSSASVFGTVGETNNEQKESAPVVPGGDPRMDTKSKNEIDEKLDEDDEFAEAQPFSNISVYSLWDLSYYIEESMFAGM